MIRQRIGFFGGTFDPVHQGHMHVANTVQELLHFDRFLLIPAARPPLRRQPLASAEHRLSMLELALQDAPGLEIDRREYLRPGLSYTIDTVESLHQEFAGAALNLVLGIDVLVAFDDWHRWHDILQQCNLLAVCRPGWQLPEQLPSWWLQRRVDWQQLKSSRAGAVAEIGIKPSSVSATVIRQLLAAGKQPTSEMLSPLVLQFINRYQLYR